MALRFANVDKTRVFKIYKDFVFDNVTTTNLTVNGGIVVNGVPLVGSTGATGSTGPNGLQGATGATDVAGLQGATGATGLEGSTGATGLSGDAGPTGDAGATGMQGATGATGLTGATGASGPIGATGDIGPTGGLGSLGGILEFSTGTATTSVVGPTGPGLILSFVPIPIVLTGGAADRDVLFIGRGSSYVHNFPTPLTTVNVSGLPQLASVIPHAITLTKFSITVHDLINASPNGGPVSLAVRIRSAPPSPDPANEVFTVLHSTVLVGGVGLTPQTVFQVAGLPPGGIPILLNYQLIVDAAVFDINASAKFSGIDIGINYTAP